MQPASVPSRKFALSAPFSSEDPLRAGALACLASIGEPVLWSGSESAEAAEDWLYESTSVWLTPFLVQGAAVVVTFLACASGAIGLRWTSVGLAAFALLIGVAGCALQLLAERRRSASVVAAMEFVAAPRLFVLGSLFMHEFRMGRDGVEWRRAALAGAEWNLEGPVLAIRSGESDLAVCNVVDLDGLTRLVLNPDRLAA